MPVQGDPFPIPTSPIGMSVDPEDHTRYVVAGTPTGWAAVNKTVRDLDEDKVKDYKEDIDTLLVFTGLFSAVLTAFVIVSYPMLSPDPQDTTNRHLARISAQTNSYTVVAGAINSTAPPDSPAPPPFQPTLTALRINYCWFASLIISLVTASFSILVKQWIREYMACELTSPQERLRVRRFRRPGLATWKVYEIAGALPLLLQVSLSLFFLGLCFFTRSDQHGIGDMCIVLVALWASCFVTATMAPAFSPQCPYNTPILKPLMNGLRHHHIVYIVCHSWRSNIQVTIQFIGNQLDRRLKNVQRFFQIEPLRTFSTNLLAPPIYTIIAFWFHSQSVILILYDRLPKDKEEADVIKESNDELSLLKEIDATLLDDDFLGTTVLDCLTQNEPFEIIDFVLEAISIRLNVKEPLKRPLHSPPDLRQLPKRGWIAVSDIVAYTVKAHVLLEHPTVLDSWVQDAIYLLLAISNQGWTPSAQQIIVRVLRGVTLPSVTRAIHSLASLATNDISLQDIPAHVQTRFSKLFSRHGVQPTEIIAFMNDLIPSPQLQPVPEPVWQLRSDLSAAMIEALGSEEQDVPWLEDAIRMLLSCPASHLLTNAVKKTIIGLCSSKTLRTHLWTAIQPLVRPNHVHFQYALHSLGEVCKDVTDGPSVDFLLRAIARCFCTERCKHSTSFLAPSLAFHALFDSEWTKQFSSILVERSKTILTADHEDWPPGSEESLQALMSLPIDCHQLNPDIPKVIFALLRDVRSVSTVLRTLVSFDQEWRSRIVMDAAIDCIKSLVQNSDTTGPKDRQEFIYVMRYACDDFSYRLTRESYEQAGTINPVRHFNLVNKIRSPSEIRLVSSCSWDWIQYHNACAKAMLIFRTEKYRKLPDDEQKETARLAGECLDVLDQLEPPPKDVNPWIVTTVFPDDIFKQLVEFIADGDGAARKSWRVRRLRKSGDIPGGESPLVP